MRAKDSAVPKSPTSKGGHLSHHLPHEEGTEELDDPFGHAEYAYSLIEMETSYKKSRGK